MGHFLTASTIYLCLLSYLLAAGCWVTGYRGSGYRSLWTTGCVFLILHAICAFHFYLGWSHLAAVNLTAEQTEEMMGFSFGEGIWFSYLLIAVWVVDVVLLWRNNGAEPRSSWWAWFTFAVHGYAFLILHAICAFHFYLGWSHLAAVNLTAEQTEEMMGFSFGEGIWFSYLLIAVWVVDVVLLWRNNGAEPRSSWWAWFTFAVHGYAFFILFNGTVVFEQGAVRWGGIVGSIWLARMAWRYRRQGIFGTSRTELSG